MHSHKQYVRIVLMATPNATTKPLYLAGHTKINTWRMQNWQWALQQTLLLCQRLSLLVPSGKWTRQCPPHNSLLSKRGCSVQVQYTELEPTWVNSKNNSSQSFSSGKLTGNSRTRGAAPTSCIGAATRQVLYSDWIGDTEVKSACIVEIWQEELQWYPIAKWTGRYNTSQGIYRPIFCRHWH